MTQWFQNEIGFLISIMSIEVIYSYLFKDFLILLCVRRAKGRIEVPFGISVDTNNSQQHT